MRQTKLREKALSCAGKVLQTTLRVVRFDRLMLRVRAGSSDPLAPGLTYGYFIALRNSLALHQSRKVRLEFEPVFNEGEVLQWVSAVRARATVARVLMPLLVALATFPYLSAFLVWRRMKRQGML